MSLQRIGPTLASFIQRPQSEILILKGRWGVGKTHSWRHLIQENSSASRIGHKSYSYVSLFGVDSLESLKTAIFVEMVDSTDVTRNTPDEKIKEKLRRIVPHVKRLPRLAEWGGSLAEAAVFTSVRDVLICLDDLERRGSNLQLNEVFGLASLLKEQRNCSIAIIANEDSLTEDARSEFRRHGEKIADIEITFSPGIGDAFDIVFEREYPFREALLRHCNSLDIRNIRILRRIKRLLDGIGEIISKCEASVTEIVTSSLVLFAWCHHDKEGDAPPPDFVKKRTLASAVATNSSNPGDREGAWIRLLESYGYRYTDQLGLSLASYAENGYLEDLDTFTTELKEKDREARASQAQSSYFQTLDLYRNTFEDNENEFIEGLVSYFRNETSTVSPLRLNEIVTTLRTLGYSEIANDLIEEFIDHFKDNLRVFDLSVYPFGSDVGDAVIRRRFQEMLSLRADTRSLGEVIRKVARNRGWHPDDIALLSSKDVNEYVDFFRSEHSEELPSLVKACLDFLQRQDPEKVVGLKAEEALRQLARESKMNKARVTRLYGITFDDQGEHT